MTESAAAIAADVERVKQVIEDLPEEWQRRYVPLHMVASRAGVDRQTLGYALASRGIKHLVALARATGSSGNTHVCFTDSCAGQVPPQPGSHQTNELGDPLPTERVCVHGHSLRLTARRRITGRRNRVKLTIAVTELGRRSRRTPMFRVDKARRRRRRRGPYDPRATTATARSATMRVWPQRFVPRRLCVVCAVRLPSLTPTAGGKSTSRRRRGRGEQNRRSGDGRSRFWSCLPRSHR